MDQAVSQFVQQWTGKDAIFQGCPTNSCMALMHLFAYNVLGIPNPVALAVQYAYMLSLNYPNYVGANFFTFVPNTPDGVPPAGAFILWKSSAIVGVPEGHVSLSLGGGNVNTFQSLDANWTTEQNPSPQPRVVTHDYTDVAGWLVPNTTIPNYNVLFPPAPVVTPPAQQPAPQVTAPATTTPAAPATTTPVPAAALPNLSLPGSPDATTYANMVTKSDNFDAVSAYLGMGSQQAVQVGAGQTVVQKLQQLQATIRVQNAQIAGLKTLTKSLASKSPTAPMVNGPVTQTGVGTPQAGFTNGQPAVNSTPPAPATPANSSQNGAASQSQGGVLKAIGALFRTIFW